MQFFSNGGSGDFIFLKPAPSSFGNTTNLLLHAPTTNNNDYVVQEALPATLYNKNLLDNTNDIAASYLQTSNIWQPVYIKENTPSAANQVLITSNTTSAQWSYIPNSAISNPFVEIITGNSLQGGGNVVLGNSITLSHIDSTVNPGHYGSSTKVPVFTVNQQGHITYSSNIDISPITINTLDGLNGGGTVYPNQSIDISIDVPVNANIGGTGITSYLVGDLLYASAPTTLSKLSSVPTGNVLTTSGINTAPNWGKVGLNTHTDGVLESSKGGTGTNNNYNITLSGSLTTGGSFTTNNAISFNTSGPSTLTLPTSGTLINSDVNTLNSLSAVGTISSGTWSATPIAANKGGTGQTSYTIGDLLYASGVTTLSKINAVDTGNVLISGGIGTAPSWGKVNLATSLSGIISVSNGGTGTNTLTSGNFLIGAGTNSVDTSKVAPSGTVVGTTDTQILTNKTLTDSTTWFQDESDNTKKLQFQLSGITTGTTRTLTIPDISDTLVTLTGGQTLTNKTLTSPVISTISNTGTLTLPTTSDTLVGRATTDTLTNKTLTDSTTWFQDEADNTKKLQFQLSGITTGTTRTLTIPNTNDTLVTLAATQTLTNKTLTTPIISSISNTGTITLPISTDTLVGRATTDTLTNKTLTDSTTFFQDDADNTKKLQFQLSGITTATTRTLTIPNTSDTLVTLALAQTLTNKTLTTPIISSISNTGTLTLPTSTDTLVGRATTDTLTNKTLTDSTTFFQDEADNSKKLQFQLSGITTATTRTLTIPNTSDTLVTLALAQTLTNKTLTTPIISSISNTGTLTLPTSTDTLVGRATTDTLTNKTLTSPIISTISNTGTLTLPTSTDTLVGRATTDTLTNKTLTGSSNTIAASQLRTTGSDVVISGAAAPSTGQVLTATSATTAAWQNIIIYRCEVYNTYGGAFSIGAGSTTVTWNSVTSDIYSMFNGSTTITVPVAGVYGIEVGHFMTQTNPSNNIQVLFLKVNGVTVASDYIDYSAVTTYIGQANLAATYYCAANDPIIVTTNTGIYSAFGVNNTVTRFRVTRLT